MRNNWLQNNQKLHFEDFDLKFQGHNDKCLNKSVFVYVCCITIDWPHY